MLERLKDHLPEYVIEAWCLGTFMISACAFTALLFHPLSPVTVLPFWLRGAMIGIAMGATAIGIITSPFGRRSGAHFNPAVTITFFRLGKITGLDAVAYIASQFAGGILGVMISWAILGDMLSDAAVNFAVTLPGPLGTGAAFAAELAISFLMMGMVLVTSNSPRLSAYTPYLAGLLVASFITFESPLSGMSMNPARSFASSAVAGNFTAWWVYFTAPVAAMLLAAELYVRTRGAKAVLCAKLYHRNAARCIFNCNY